MVPDFISTDGVQAGSTDPNDHGQRAVIDGGLSRHAALERFVTLPFFGALRTTGFGVAGHSHSRRRPAECPNLRHSPAK